MTSSLKSEVELEIIEPQNVGINTLFLEAVWKVFKMLLPKLGIGSVVIGDKNGVVFHAQIAFQSTEEMLGQME